METVRANHTGLAERHSRSYLTVMALPRPASPAAAYRDLRDFFAARQKHEVGFALLAIAVPAFFILMFVLSAKETPYKDPDIVFILDYSGNRTDAQIIAQQKIDQAKARAQKAKEDAEEERRRQFFKDIGNGMDSIGL